MQEVKGTRQPLGTAGGVPPSNGGRSATSGSNKNVEGGFGNKVQRVLSKRIESGALLKPTSLQSLMESILLRGKGHASTNLPFSWRLPENKHQL